MIEFSLDSLDCNKEMRGKRDKINYIFVKSKNCNNCAPSITNNYTITSIYIDICSMSDLFTITGQCEKDCFKDCSFPSTDSIITGLNLYFDDIHLKAKNISGITTFNG